VVEVACEVLRAKIEERDGKWGNVMEDKTGLPWQRMCCAMKTTRPKHTGRIDLKRRARCPQKEEERGVTSDATKLAKGTI
jgi:hypothetical protein